MRVRYLLAAGLLIVGNVLGRSAYAQETESVKEIVAKVNARLAKDKIKTYECMMQMNIEWGAMKLSIQATTLSAANQFRMEGIMQLPGKESNGEKVERQMLFIANGTKAQMVISTPKEYHVKEMAAPHIDKVVLPWLSTTSEYTLLPMALLDDQPVFVLENIIKTKGMSIITTYYIDRTTYRITRCRRAGTPAEGEPLRVLMTLKSEKINEPIPDRLFKFTPPQGLKRDTTGRLLEQNPPSMMLLGMMGVVGR